MSQQLLLAAREQAERSETAVGAAALMHIARVLARSDQAAAEQLLEQGIALAREVDGDATSLLLSNAISLAAAVSPKHALPLYTEYRRMDPFGGPVVSLVNVMAGHGHIGDAIEYLNDPLPGDRFPLHFVNNLEQECRDDETRRKLLALAIREWRNPAPRSDGPEEQFAGRSFAGFFGRYWNLLPRDVAASVLTELVDWVLSMKSEPREYTFSGQEDPKLASEQEFELFILVPVLQSLEPDLAHSVLEDHPQLAAAVKRFPLGFANDTDAESPNSAHKECWPSGSEFRHILFKAGQHQGVAAAKHLDRIPDADLRLFAQIELCAALAGLPQLGGLTTQHRSNCRMLTPAELDQIFGSFLSGIRCPQCKWTPRTKNLWSCKCEHHWNTFDTRGLCPGCGHQWEITGCLQCGAMSPHAEWYVDN